MVELLNTSQWNDPLRAMPLPLLMISRLVFSGQYDRKCESATVVTSGTDCERLMKAINDAHQVVHFMESHAAMYSFFGENGAQPRVRVPSLMAAAAASAAMFFCFLSDSAFIECFVTRVVPIFFASF